MTRYGAFRAPEPSADPPRPFDAVLVPQPEESPWSWDGRYGLVLTGSGVFVIEGERFYRSMRPATMEDLVAAFGPTGRELFRGRGWASLRLSFLVPQYVLLQAWSFFLAAWQRYRTEDILLLYFFSRDKQYTLVHPLLRYASGTNVGYDIPDTPEGAVLFGTVHSHPCAAASPSAEDDRDVRGTPGLHIILGGLDRSLPSIACVLSTRRECLRVRPQEVFEDPLTHSFPDAWLERPTDLPRAPRSDPSLPPRKEEPGV